MLDKIKKNLHYIIPPVLVILIFMIIMLLKGIYPFGSNLVANMDMDAGYIPIYYKLWDILHGNSSLFYDFNLGAGNGVYGSLVMNSLFSPITWLVYFVPRSFVPNFMSYLVLIKLSLMSVTAYYAYNKLFKKTDRSYKILFSILYALSGYTLLMYSNIMWFDNLILFPLLILGLKEIYERKKSKMFVIVLTLSLMFSYYISFMFLIFMLVATTLYLIIYKPNNKREIMTKLFIYILSSLLISSISVLPSLMQSLSGYKFTNNDIVPYTLEKIIYLFPSVLPIILFIKQMFNFKKDKKNTLFLGLLFLLTCIGLVVEPINKMWHTGSYEAFPFRYAFIPIFILILGSLYYLDTHNNKVSKTKVDSKLVLIVYVIMNLLLMYAVYTFKDIILVSNIALSIEYLKQFIALLIIFVICTLIMILSIISSDRIRKYLIYFSAIVEIIVFGFLYINISDVSGTKNTNKIENNFNIVKDTVYKYKDNTATLNSNYGYQLLIPTNGKWQQNITKEQMINHSLLGYVRDDSILYSSGGTIFSDLITGNRYIFSYYEMPENLYGLIEKKENTYYYTTKYNLNYIIPYSGTIYNDLDTSTFDYQNNIYETLFNKDDNIIDIINPDLELNNIKTKDNIYYATNENSNISFKVNVKENSYVYLNMEASGNNVTSIKVNGVAVKNPIMIDRQNTSYLLSDQNTLFLGNYENEELTITIPIDSIIIENLKVGIINTDKFINLVNDNKKIEPKIETKMSTMKIVYDNYKHDKALLIPINYLDGYTITVNNKKVNYKKNLNNYISIPIDNDLNNIVIKYRPAYYDLGLYISLISLIIFNLFSYLNKKFKLSKNKIINTFFAILFILFDIIFLLKIYILCLF